MSTYEAAVSNTRTAVADYIETSYNVRQRHSTLDYMSPVEFELKPPLSRCWIKKGGHRKDLYLRLNENVYGIGAYPST